MEKFEKKYKKYFPDYAWNNLIRVINKHKLDPTSVGKWLEKYHPKDKYFPAANM